MSFWTEERVQRLRDLHAQHLTAGRLAKTLEAETGLPVTRNAVISKGDRMGLKFARPIYPPPAPSSLRKVPAKPGTFSMPTYQGTKANPLEKKLESIRANLAAQTSPASNVVGLAWQPLAGVQPVPFVSRTGAQCRWPVDVPEGGFWACGAETGGAVYCRKHAKIANPPPIVRERLDQRLGISARRGAEA